MSDTMIAVVILPFLIGLTVVLECTRVGCTRVLRHVREAKREAQLGSEHAPHRA
jgi:hypothetical protein